MSEHVIPRKTYYTIFAALLILTAVTTAVAFIDLGAFNVFAALGIAIAKATLVVLFFMHVFYSGRLIMVVVAVGLFWFGVLIVLTLNDYLTRGWTPMTAPPGFPW